MSADEYRRALDRLELSQMAAAPFLGIAPRTSQSFALGETRVHKSVAMLLRLMVAHGLAPDDAESAPSISKQ